MCFFVLCWDKCWQHAEVSSRISCVAAVCEWNWVHTLWHVFDLGLLPSCRVTVQLWQDRPTFLVLVRVFIVTLWCKVTTPSLSMIFYQSWVQGTTSPNLTRGTAGRWILLSLRISLLDQIVLFPFTSEEQSAALQLCLKSATSLNHGATVLRVTWSSLLCCLYNHLVTFPVKVSTYYNTKRAAGSQLS